MIDRHRRGIFATPTEDRRIRQLTRRNLLAAGAIFFLWPPTALRATENRLIPLPRPVLYDGSTSAYLAWGRSPFAQDLSVSPSYGGSETFVLRSPGGRLPEAEERDAQRRLEAKAGKIISAGADVIPRLLSLVHETHVRHQSAPKSAPVEDAGDALLNLAARSTACGDVATALSTLLNRAGIRTRILMLAQEPNGLGRADHVALEAYSREAGRWLLLEGLLGAGPVKGGISPRPSLGFLDLIADPAAMAALNAAHKHAYYTDRTSFAAILPDPDYSRPIEILWVPTHAAANRFLSKRFGSGLAN